MVSWIEREDDNVDESALETEFVEEDVEKLGAELYDVLCTVTSDEPLTIVRSEASMNGFMAWKKMCRRYSPRTPAKALMAMVEVMNPKRVSEITFLPKAIDAWELKAVKLER